MPPISRREQVELDELLSDIYRGIETLPDHSRSQGGASYIITRKSEHDNKSPIIGRAYTREFEVSESSPLVQRHKQALAAERQQQSHVNASASSYNPQAQPQRSTLKRQTGGGSSQTPDLGTSQSLASFLNAHPATGPPSSITPEGKRRVRILDRQPEKYTSDPEDQENEYDDEDDYALNEYVEPQSNQFDSVYVSTTRNNNNNNNNSSKKRTAKPEKVKYVNTNKLIYHQERDLDDNQQRATESENEEDDDIDGVTRTEYYHTTWLDRQLGRASKRRSSKELNERQVKEKAMIEELKQSLKNGAITLKQSLKGKNKTRHNKASDIFDDLDDNNNNKFSNNSTDWTKRDPYNSRSSEQPQVVKTGIATLPRNHHHNHKKSSKKHEQQLTSHWSHTLAPKSNRYQSQRLEKQEDHYSLNKAANRQYKPVAQQQNEPLTREQTYEVSKVSKYSSPSINQQQQRANIGGQPETQAINSMQSDYQDNSQYSRTLPHRKPEQPHQLLQSHYRGTLNSKSNTLNRLDSPKPTPTSYAPKIPAQLVQQQIQQAQHQHQQDTMRNPAHNNCPSPVALHGGNKSPLQQSVGNTVNVPSATEVVRSALSRSSSQVSLNQLNKTINLLPTSPPAPSPMTPTQQLRAASPSLSPSPAPTRSPMAHQYASKTLGPQRTAPQQQYLPGQTVLHGTRTIERPPSQQRQQQPQQPVYANPHASLMQHRMEQQAKVPNKNVASIREFNELDSLLRSLSPGMPGAGYSSTQITPGYTNRAGQASVGGYMPANYQPQQQQQHQQHQQQQQQQQQPVQYNKPSTSDVYAKVQKPANNQTTGPGFIAPASSSSQPFTIDVTDKKLDENCAQRQRQEVSEFETPIELLPSMEDYQNITKLNPVKNHYWYKPNMSRELAIYLLKDKPQGTFIVRDSTSFKGAYGLAVRVAKLPKNVLANLRNSNGDQSAEYIRHFLIEPTGSGVRLKGYANEPVFDSLPDLIYQHSLTELALPCKLIIPRADIEDPRFNQKQKQFFDEFIASKEKAKHQPYERTSPDGGYRRYPGNVLVHNEHRIIFQ